MGKRYLTEVELKNIEALKSGDFSILFLEHWFANHHYDYIYATIRGLEKNNNSTLMSLIVLYARRYMAIQNADKFDRDSLIWKIKNSGSEPSGLDDKAEEELREYWNEEIKDNARGILIKCISLASRVKNYIPSLNALATSTDELVRLHYCANLADETCGVAKYLEDPSPRIRKVAAIKANFTQKWNGLSNTDAWRINFLADALRYGVILCYDGDVGRPDDSIFARFSSSLFVHGVTIPKFDEDIFYTFEDKRILADSINEMIKDGRIVVNREFMPEEFFGDSSIGEGDGPKPMRP